MGEHYYSQKPTVDHDEKLIEETFFGRKYTFKTDAGVFSKNRVDFGSTLLINTFTHKESAKVLDLGCGYGPIGTIIASRLESGTVFLADINERAVQLSNYNLKLNQHLINDKVNLIVQQSNGFEGIIEREFDYILLNPPIRAGKALIFEMYEQSLTYLKSGGELWVVIQKKQGAESTFKKLATLFSEVEEVEKDKGYSIIKSVKK